MHYRNEIVRGYRLKSALLILVSALIVMVFNTPAYARQQGDDTGELPEIVFRATDFVGQPVLNSDGEPIAEIGDVILTGEGRIQHVVLEVGGLLGIAEKQVAIDFGDLRIESRWHYRIVRTRDGTEVEVPWTRYPRITYPGTEAELRDKPAYAYPQRAPRGGTKGWGIYSYPAGPKRVSDLP